MRCLKLADSIEGICKQWTNTLKRTSKKIQFQNISEFKSKLFDWSQKYNHIVWLDSNNYEQKYSGYDVVLAVGAYTFLETNYTNAFADIFFTFLIDGSIHKET